MPRQYVTTAIDYPNAPPHMGHVLEKVLADVMVRWMRLRGDDVRFQVGTDEHGVKIQQTAQKTGITPAELVNRNVPLFQDLYSRLDISYDVFVRTTDAKGHWPTVSALWEKLRAAGALEKRTYTGLYCAGCERFLTKKDLVDGVCPLHLVPPQEVREENWFFLLSKKQEWLKSLLTSTEGYRIEPSFRAPETLTLIEQGLEDVSFSRPKSSLAWGIPVPGDPDQTMYVWCDALTNYISGLGLLTDHAEPQWWDDATVTHVIGKDIARFHALIWPAMLGYAGIRTPDRLLIHGFLTSEGQKMSKSLGNVVVPDDVLAKFNGNPDPLRFYLTHEIPVGNDGDFSWKRFDELYQAKLGDRLGNLLNRVLVLLKKIDAKIAVPATPAFAFGSGDPWKQYESLLNAFDLWKAMHFVMEGVEACDKYITEREPWKIKDVEQRREVLSILAENLRHISLMLLPFLPRTAQKMAVQLGLPDAAGMLEKTFVLTPEKKSWGGAAGWMNVGVPEILFPRLAEEK